MALSSSTLLLLYYALAALCITYVFFPSPLPGWFPLYIWAIGLSLLNAVAFLRFPTWLFWIFVITSFFAVHVTRRYVMYLKQPVGIFDLTQYTSTDGSGVLPASRTQAVFSPAPALTREERRTYLESLKFVPRRLGGNNFNEKTLEETMVEELTPLGKSFLLPVGQTPSLPGLYLGLDKSPLGK